MDKKQGRACHCLINTCTPFSELACRVQIPALCECSHMYKRNSRYDKPRLKITGLVLVLDYAVSGAYQTRLSDSIFYFKRYPLVTELKVLPLEALGWSYSWVTRHGSAWVQVLSPARWDNGGMV